MEIFLPPRVLSFFMLSLPETQGTVKVVVKRLVRPDKLSELVFPVRRLFTLHRIRPAEVVQTGQMGRIRADGHRLPDCHIHGRRHHVIRVNIAVPRHDSGGKDHALRRQRLDHENSRIGSHIVLHAGIRLDHAESLHLVIVLPRLVLAGADVQTAEHRKHIGLHGTPRQIRLLEMLRLPDRLEVKAGKSVVHKGDVQTRNHAIPVKNAEFSIIRELSEHRRLHIALLCDPEELIQILRRHGETHALLRLRDQNFPRFESGILQRRLS